MRRLVFVLSALVLALPIAARADDSESAEEQAFRKAKSDGAVLLRKIGEAKDPKHHDELLAQFDALEIRAQVVASVEGLKQKKPTVRQLCIKRLKDLGVVQAVPHLVLVATNDADEAVRLDAQAAARDLDPDFARRWYEHVAVQDSSHRTHAIDGIASLGTRAAAAVPLLAGMMDVTRTTEVGDMAYVGIDVNATNATQIGSRTVPTNLGSNNRAGTQVPIELPELSIDQVRTTVTVPAASLNPWRDTARSALRSVVGADLGSDSDAWREWWKKHKQEVLNGTWRTPTYTPSSDPVDHALAAYVARETDAASWAKAKETLKEGGKETLRRLLAIASDPKRSATAFAVMRAITGELIPDDAGAWKAHVDSLK